MSDTETTPSDPRDNCPECGERGRFDLGTVQTCGCPTECGDCGHTMTDDHECEVVA